jgi:alginate O-acetyltransferase complex protein AlgI
LIPSLKTLAQIIFTFTIVCVGWVFFRANTLSDAWLILRKIVTGASYLEGYFFGLQSVQEQPLGNYLLVAMAFLVIGEWIQRREPHPLSMPRWPRPLRWATYCGFASAIMFGGTFSSTQFMYFQF